VDEWIEALVGALMLKHRRPVLMQT
jgi:hypothetical protein